MTLTYCGNIVRQQDSDKFLLSLFVPVKHRWALWALFAFNHEIAKTRDVVSETTIGLIRLQWWRDAIGEVYEGKEPRHHEIVQELAKAIKQYDLPRDLFDNLIYAREFDLEGVAPADMEGLIKYCEFTSVPLFQLVLRITGQVVGQNGGNDTMLMDISKRFALIGVIRSVPYMLLQGRVLLPSQVLQEFNLNEKKLIDFNEKEKLPQIIKCIVEDKKYFQNDSCGKNKPKFMRKISHMTAIYKSQLSSVEYDVFNPRMGVTPKFMALRLWLKG